MLPVLAITVVDLRDNTQHTLHPRELSLAALHDEIRGVLPTLPAAFTVHDLSGAPVQTHDVRNGDVYSVAATAEGGEPAAGLVEPLNAGLIEGGGTVAAADGKFLDFNVDITPDVELLIKGGDDYDLVTALAELLDNSIQNTVRGVPPDDRGADAVPRLLTVEMLDDAAADGGAASASAQPLPGKALRIFDNGCGMTVGGLKNWAVLGRHRPSESAGVDGDDLATPQQGQGQGKQERHCMERSMCCEGDVAGATEASFRCDAAVADYLTSDFSRYGVGSKKAVFSLGDSVVVTTRRAGSPWVSECVLSKAHMRKDGWRTTLSARAPTEAEAAHQSFTCFTIRELKQVHLDTYSQQHIAAWLAHVYHYYVWGPRGNRGGRAAEDDAGEETAACAGPLLDILVDGENVRSAARDLDAETLLLQNGVERVTFDLTLGNDLVRLYEHSPVPVSSTGLRAAPSRLSAQLTQGEAEGASQTPPSDEVPEAKAPEGTQEACRSTDVKVVLHYFPFKDGAETMPIPVGFGGAAVNADGRVATGAADEDLPLCDRKPGLEVFWNGRLLPREFLEHWPLLKPGTTRQCDTPAACFRRVKGQIFIDAAFEVTANKHSLSKETALARALTQYTNRQLHANVKKWVAYCHKTHDEELIFGAVDKDRLKGDGVIQYLSVKVTNILLERGKTWVLAKQATGRGKLIGLITEIFTNHRVYEAAHGCSVRVQIGYSSNSSVSGDAILAVGQVQRVLTEDEAKEEMKKNRRAHPTVLSTTLPPSMPAAAAASLPTRRFKVSMCSDDGKVMRRDASLTVTCFATGAASRKPLSLTHRLKSLPSGSNEYTVNFADLKPAVESGAESEEDDKAAPAFMEFAGVYMFKFVSSLATIKPLEVSLNVLPVVDDLSKLSFNFSGGGGASGSAVIPSVTIDKDFPAFEMHVADPLGNAVPYELLAATSKSQAPVNPFEKLAKKGKNAVPAPPVLAVSVALRNPPPAAESIDEDATPPARKPFALSTEAMQVRSLPGGFRVESGIRCSGDVSTLPPPADGEKHAFVVTVSCLEGALSREVTVLQVIAGKPTGVESTCLPRAVGWKQPFALAFRLVDAYGNAALPAESQHALMCELKVSGNGKLEKSPVVANITADARFCFNDVVLVRPAKQPPAAEDVELTLQAACFYLVKERKKATNLTLSHSLTVRPPSSYPHILIEEAAAAAPAAAADAAPAKRQRRSAAAAAEGSAEYDEYRTVVHTTALDTVVQTVVGRDLSTLHAVFHNPPSWVAHAVVRCPWVDAAAGAEHACFALRPAGGAAGEGEGASPSQQRYAALLPPLRAPTKEGRATHDVVVHKLNDDSEQIQHRLTVSYAKAGPAALHLVSEAPEEVSQGKAFTLQFRVTDAYDNVLPVKTKVLQDAKLSAVLVLHPDDAAAAAAEAAAAKGKKRKRGDAKGDGGGDDPTEGVALNGETLATKARDTTYSLQGLRLSGRAGKVGLCVTLEGCSAAAAGVRASVVVGVELACGAPAAVTVSGAARPEEEPLQLETTNLGALDAMKIGLVDAYGNACPIGKRRVVLDSSKEVKLLKMQSKEKTTALFDSRTGTFTPRLLAAARPGPPEAYPIAAVAHVYLEDLPKSVIKGHVRVKLSPGRLPYSVTARNVCDSAVTPSLKAGAEGATPPASQPLQASRPLSVEAGQLAASVVLTGGSDGPALQLEILGENGEVSEYLPSDRVSLQMSSPALPSAVTWTGPPTASQTTAKPEASSAPVAFAEFSKYAPTHAGPYTARAELDLFCHKHKDALERVKFLKRKVDVFTFVVVPAAPAVVRGRLFKDADDGSGRRRRGGGGEGSAWGASLHLGGASAGKPLFATVSLRVEDAYGNMCDGLSEKAALRVRVGPYSDTDGAGGSASQLPTQQRRELPLVRWTSTGAESAGAELHADLSQGEGTLPGITVEPHDGCVEGSYCLLVSRAGGEGDVKPLVLPFYYADNSAKQRKVEKLARHKREWDKLCVHLEKKLSRIDRARVENEEAEGVF